MNKVILTGKLGKEPEIKQVNTGLNICNLTVATSENVKKGDEWEKQTEWHNVVIFGKRAEYIFNNAAKGSTVSVIGKIKTETWEKNGEKKSKVVIIAEEIELLAGKAVKEPKLENNAENKPDDDIPF